MNKKLKWKYLLTHRHVVDGEFREDKRGGIHDHSPSEHERPSMGSSEKSRGVTVPGTYVCTDGIENESAIRMGIL